MPNNGASEYVRTPAGNTATYAPGTKTRDFSYQGSDTVLHIGNDLELVPDLWLTTGLAAIYTRRETQVTYPEGQAPLSQHDWDYAPRIGLRYEFSPQLQVYGNLSRSVEPPHAWSMIWGSNSISPAVRPGPGPRRREPENQTATTLELGGRGEACSASGTWRCTAPQCATNCSPWKPRPRPRPAMPSSPSPTPAPPCTKA
jgi:iron complex outermembrane receptor protein